MPLFLTIFWFVHESKVRISDGTYPRSPEHPEPVRTCTHRTVTPCMNHRQGDILLFRTYVSRQSRSNEVVWSWTQPGSTARREGGILFLNLLGFKSHTWRQFSFSVWKWRQAAEWPISKNFWMKMSLINYLGELQRDSHHFNMIWRIKLICPRPQ